METQIETMLINGVEYVRKDAVKENVPMGEKRIVVADRGWVFVGDCVDGPNGLVTIHNAKTIRYWGTTQGLGELCNGPTSKTKADPVGTITTTPIACFAVTRGW